MDRLDKDAEIACSLNDEEFRARRNFVRAEIQGLVLGHQRDGNKLTVELQSGDDARATVQDFISLEQQCCGFLNFALSDEGVSPAQLVISGPEEATATLDMFHIALQSG